MKFVKDQEEAWRAEKEEAAKQKKQETDALIAHQQAMKLSNEQMHDKHTQKEMYASLLAWLPKFSGSQNPDAFINALDKQLVDSNISV